MNDEIEYLRKVYQSEDTSTWVNKLQMKSIVDYTDKLQSNWNSLRECIIDVIEGSREELNTIIHTTDSFTYANQCCREFDVIRKNLEIVLDKMNELESGDNK